MGAIQLRVRTEFSFGATFAPVQRVVDRLKEIGCPAAGIVDSSTWGHVAWFAACKEAGIQPLLGAECVVADDGDEAAKRMWFLAKDTASLAELYRALTTAHRQPMTTNRGTLPRLYTDDVLSMSKSIFKFAGDWTDGKFLKEAGAYLDLNPGSRVLNNKKLALASEFKLKCVSTSDNAFAAPGDKEIFELAARGGLKPSPQFILPELEHQAEAARIAKACTKLALPSAPMIHFKGDLEEVCRAGIKQRKMPWNDKYEARLRHELALIKEKDYESYFLVVADMVQFAKQHMLVGPSRGSAAGSLVCYLSRITEIDPIPPGLFFERFIDVSRTDLPDIDLDFPDDKRHLVFEYMANKYGQANVAKLGTVSDFKPKSALITVCKALNIPPAATAAVKVAMIERTSGDSRASNCLEDTFTTTDPGRKFIASYPQAIKAAALEGHASHSGVHAAGLIICNAPITNFCVVDANGIAAVDKKSAEKLGLLKIDVLGLRTLGILEDSGVPIDWYALKFEDKKTLDIFNKQKFCGIFQFEGNALREVSKQVHFNSLREIDAVTALARPGPFGGGVTAEYIQRMNGKEHGAIHPLVEPFMRESYQLPIYQEQTLAIVREIGKFDWVDTSAIRKAMSGRLGREFFDRYWEKFRVGAMEQGVPEKEARATWELINSMGAWQMNKAHTFSYAVISFWTAYLKAHHPLEFAAANLRSAKDEESAVQLLREMTNEGLLRYRAFDLQLSEENWTAKEGELIGGFMNLRGVGESKAKVLREARDAGKLTEKQLKDISEAENIFADIFPMRTKFGALYDKPEKFGIDGPLWRIGELNGEQEGSVVFLGRLIHKNMRDANEDVNVKKRGGKLVTGPREFLDVRIQDDTGSILARVGRYDFNKFGKQLFAEVPMGTPLLVRARVSRGFRFGFIQKWKRLDEEVPQ